MKADLEVIYCTSGSVITPLKKKVLDMNTVSYLAFAVHTQGNFLVTFALSSNTRNLFLSLELGSGLNSQFIDFELDSG